jgi:hypothetical protein
MEEGREGQCAAAADRSTEEMRKDSLQREILKENDEGGMVTREMP